MATVPEFIIPVGFLTPDWYSVGAGGFVFVHPPSGMIPLPPFPSLSNVPPLPGAFFNNPNAPITLVMPGSPSYPVSIAIPAPRPGSTITGIGGMNVFRPAPLPYQNVIGWGQLGAYGAFILLPAVEAALQAILGPPPLAGGAKPQYPPVDFGSFVDAISGGKPGTPASESAVAGVPNGSWIGWTINPYTGVVTDGNGNVVGQIVYQRPTGDPEYGPGGQFVFLPPPPKPPVPIGLTPGLTPPPSNWDSIGAYRPPFLDQPGGMAALYNGGGSFGGPVAVNT